MGYGTTKHSPEFMRKESQAQMDLINEIGDTFTQMHTATTSLVGTDEWNGRAAHEADTLVNNFVHQTAMSLEELGDRAHTCSTLANSSEENDEQYTQETLSIDLPSIQV